MGIPLGMPKLAYVTTDPEKRVSYLGPDTDETKQLKGYDLKRKLRLCESIVTALQGKGYHND